MPSCILQVSNLCVHEKPKQPIPSKNILGILNLREVSTVHPRFLPDTMQLAGVSRFCSKFSNGCCNMLVASKKFLIKLRVASWLMFSHPSGKPASKAGKWRVRIWIWRPDSLARSIMELNLMALRGVVTMVTLVPCWANSLAMSIIGMRWPGDIKGTKTK
ncbi:hypothetical protein TorRG33x02_025850 [Trema orientale]|uniref:Uncharacterized protein n=1 Tax=Trema orientale TaxID=63057 RepID=A0A2P5FVK2_TREOI|nr:hypothetical protein TorRG33x02_025850 [Trema orientale]